MNYFTTIPHRTFKTYFVYQEKGSGHWKYIKQRIKNILDSPQISRYEKILEITSILEDYRKRYLDD